MKGIGGSAFPFTTTPAQGGSVGFTSFGTKITGFNAPPQEQGGTYPKPGELDSLPNYGVYVENLGFGTPWTVLGDTNSVFGMPSLSLGGIGTDAYSIKGKIFGTPYISVDLFTNEYQFGNMPTAGGVPIGLPDSGFYANGSTGVFAINAGGNPYKPPIYFNQGNLSFNVGFLTINAAVLLLSNPQLFSTSSAGAFVKHLVITDNTGQRLMIPCYAQPR